MGSRYIVHCISDSEFEIFRPQERWWLSRDWVCRLAWVGSDSLGIDADGVAFLPEEEVSDDEERREGRGNVLLQAASSSL